MSARDVVGDIRTAYVDVTRLGRIHAAQRGRQEASVSTAVACSGATKPSRQSVAHQTAPAPYLGVDSPSDTVFPHTYGDHRRRDFVRRWVERFQSFGGKRRLRLAFHRCPGPPGLLMNQFTKPTTAPSEALTRTLAPLTLAHPPINIALTNPHPTGFLTTHRRSPSFRRLSSGVWPIGTSIMRFGTVGGATRLSTPA